MLSPIRRVDACFGMVSMLFNIDSNFLDFASQAGSRFARSTVAGSGVAPVPLSPPGGAPAAGCATGGGGEGVCAFTKV